MSDKKTTAAVEQDFLNAFSANMANPVNMDKLGVGYKAFKDAQKGIGSNGKLEVFDTNKPYGALWNHNTDEYFTLGHGVPVVQMMMRRCVCTGNPAHGGNVYKYLDAEDSSKYEDGSDASGDIAGANGYQVFVEIPKFYEKRTQIGSMNYYEIALHPFEGSTTHTLFRRQDWTAGIDGTDKDNEVAFDYVSAFEAVLYDASAATYIDGNGNSDNTSNIDLASDKLVSVAGFKPYTGLTRAESRTLVGMVEVNSLTIIN